MHFTTAKIVSFPVVNGQTFVLLEGGWQFPCNISKNKEDLVGKEVNLSKYASGMELEHCIDKL